MLKTLNILLKGTDKIEVDVDTVDGAIIVSSPDKARFKLYYYSCPPETRMAIKSELGQLVIDKLFYED